jgi:hypothetical protein
MTILDGDGDKWAVRGGDPAARLIARLTRANYGLVVLPVRALMTGDVGLAVPIENPESAEQVRHNDCLMALED